MNTSLSAWTIGALVSSAQLAAGAPLGPAPVVGGELARNDPAVVALTTHGGTIYCSGTLVSPSIIVTAAHCLHGLQPPVRVFIGTDPASDGLFVPVAWAIEHPDYAKKGLADIGLVLLARPVTIRPVLLPEHDFAQHAPTGPLRLLGFGDTEPSDPHAPVGVKFGREVALAGVENYFLHYGVGACHGDSGGPTFAREADGTERLVGVISRGDADCVTGGYSTRVDLYRDWVASWIENVDPASCDLDLRCTADCEALDPDCADAAASAPPASAGSAGGCTAGGGGGGLPLALLVLGLALHRRRS